MQKSVVAIGAALVALWARFLLDPYLGDHMPYPTFFVAVGITVIYAGVWPAIVVVAISGLAADWFFVSPRYSFAIGTRSDQIGHLTFVLASFILVSFGYAFDRARNRAAEVMKQLRLSQEELRLLAGGLERLVEERTRDLTQSQERLRGLATELNLAEQRERKRLATELHDHLAQMLVLAKMKVSQAKQIPGFAPRGQRFLSEIDEALTQSLSYTRTLVADLAPPALRDFGLLAALRGLSEQMRHHGLFVALHSSFEHIKLPEDQAVLLFQSIKELLTNVVKHAQSDETTITLSIQIDMLRIEVRDNGVGFSSVAGEKHSPDGSSKFGLFSIGERMRALGGTFEVESMPGRGTMARLTLPVTESL